MYGKLTALFYTYALLLSFCCVAKLVNSETIRKGSYISFQHILKMLNFEKRYRFYLILD